MRDDYTPRPAFDMYKRLIRELGVYLRLNERFGRTNGKGKNAATVVF